MKRKKSASEDLGGNYQYARPVVLKIKFQLVEQISNVHIHRNTYITPGFNLHVQFKTEHSSNYF